MTIDGTTRPLPEPFFVIATQNPIESQGTYPLPEAQLDRFLFKLDVRHPTHRRSRRRSSRTTCAGFDASALDRMDLERVITPEELIAMQTAIRGVRVDDSLLEYIADIVGPHARRTARCTSARRRARRSRCWRARRRAPSARGPRLRHPRRRQGAGAGGAPPPRRPAARRRDRGRVGRRLRRRDPARGPRPRHDRRLSETIACRWSRRCASCCSRWARSRSASAMAIDASLLAPMLAADGALVLLAVLDALLARGRARHRHARGARGALGRARESGPAAAPLAGAAAAGRSPSPTTARPRSPSTACPRA